MESIASGKRALVVGLGVSGMASLRFLRARGVQVVVGDQRSEAEPGARAQEALALGALPAFAEPLASRFDEVDFVVVSPGVPPLPELLAARDRGLPLLGDIDLAMPFLHGTRVGITGTNGKSTVTSLVGEMCKATGRPTFVGGNLGRPLVEAVGSEAAEASGFVVAELSSFQLSWQANWHGHVAVLLNLGDDHLDWHGSKAAYAAAKGRIFQKQGAGDFAIYPLGDPICAPLAELSPGRKIRFGAQGAEVSLEGGRLRSSLASLDLPLEEIALRGAHNHLNACAAAATALALGIDVAQITQVLRSFSGLPHRMNYVGKRRGLHFFDDSKATNVAAAVAAIDGLDLEAGAKIVLLAGGRHKGGSFAPLRHALEGRGRALVLFGECKEEIAAAFAGSELSVAEATSIEEAVLRAAELAQPGDRVLLAPATASWDMFRSYVERGERFQAAVRQLAEEGER